MTMQSYRVWVEKHQSGWVHVEAPNEEMAKDLAQQIALRQSWYSERSSATPCRTEEVKAHVNPVYLRREQP